MIFVDTNVIIDAVDPRERWHEWSRQTIARQAFDGFVINHVVVAELHARPDGVSGFPQWREAFRMTTIPLSDDAAMRAGIAHGIYRARGGRSSILADFLIGGHCAALGAKLVTRDPRRFAGYFPELVIITPGRHDV